MSRIVMMRQANERDRACNPEMGDPRELAGAEACQFGSASRRGLSWRLVGEGSKEYAARIQESLIRP